MSEIKLSNRLSLVVIAITVFMGASLSLFRLSNNYTATLDRINEAVTSHLNETEAIAQDAIFKLDEPISKSLVDGSTANQYIVRSELFADDGEKLAESTATLDENIWRPSFFGVLDVPNKERRHPIIISQLGAEALGEHVVEIDYHAGLQDFYRQATSDALIDFLLVVMVSLIIYLISLFYIAQPVSLLAAEVDSLAPGERPSKPSLFNRNDELGSLARNTYEYMVKSHEFAARLQNEQMERLELEEKLRHSQKMDAIGQLAGGIAHDFNNIMTVIMGNANLAQTFLAQGKEERIEKSLNAIVESSERAAKLTNQLLVFSRKDLSEPVSVVCNELIQNSAKMLERLISEEMHISYDLKPVKPILADESQIDLVLINLTVNARDAMPTGGDIKITCENTYLSAKQADMLSAVPEGEYVHISISDTGVGIDSELLERVFDPFFTTKPVGKGTGLGLSTVYGIITKWDGCINIESDVDQGTTVHIYFPVSDIASEQKEEELTPESADYNFSGKVLVCEDDDNVRTYIVDLLSTTDFEIISVANPVDAVDIYRNHKDIILLITDIIMPGMNGRELADELNTIRQVPAIFVSGYSENVFDDKGIITDDITFIQKPFTQEKLFSAVKETLAQQ